MKFWYSGNGYSSALGRDLWQIGYATSNLVTSIPDDKEVLPEAYSLAQAFPNPFNPETEISFSMPKSERVVLKIFDALGKEIATLVDEIQAVGSHTVKWKPTTIASGVYFYRMQAGAFFETKKMILMK